MRGRRVGEEGEVEEDEGKEVGGGGWGRNILS